MVTLPARPLPYRRAAPALHRRRAGPAARPASGFALIEALIAILIFSLATLGLLGLEVTMTRAQSSAKFRADAAFLANDLIGVIWADAPANIGNYDDASCAGYPACQQWRDRLAAALPAGAASASVNTTSRTVALTIRWQVPNESSHSFTTATSINVNTN
jgi:type IV pilus assembly protein PilV